MEHQYRRILIVRTDRIGDVILTLPVVQVLRDRYPGSYLAMLIRRYTADLIEDNSSIDNIIFYDDGVQPVPFLRLAGKLRSEHFDAVIHTYPRFRLALMTWIAGIPLRIGTGYRWYSFLFNKKIYEHRKDATRHELNYNLNLLKAIGCPVDNRVIFPSLEVRDATVKRVRLVLRTLGVHEESRLVIVHPGSGGSARDWSARNFGLLARSLDGIAGVQTIITGSAQERDLVEEVLRIAGGRALSLVDRLSLKEFAALAKISSLLVANSTGPIHIAAAVGTPVIGLYPQVIPMTAERWGPVTDKKIIFSPSNLPKDCNKCVKQRSPECECMDSITVAEVFGAAKTLLAGEPVRIRLHA